MGKYEGKNGLSVGDKVVVFGSTGPKTKGFCEGEVIKVNRLSVKVRYEIMEGVYYEDNFTFNKVYLLKKVGE